jgi:hypothetical protein
MNANSSDRSSQTQQPVAADLTASIMKLADDYAEAYHNAMQPQLGRFGKERQELERAIAALGSAPATPVPEPLSLEFIEKHIGVDEGDREAVLALVREVEVAHGIPMQKVADCLDNDSPWLVCKTCAARGECKNRADLATPVQPVPVELRNSAPRRIYLDIGDPLALEGILAGTTDWQVEGVTWSEDNATSHGVEYVRADLAAPTAPATQDKEKAHE